MTPPRPAAPSRLPTATVALHWLVAIGIVFMLAFGFWISGQPRGPGKTELVQVHKSFGMIVFAFAVCRVVWRFRVGFPESHGIGWEARAARASHLLLLAATIVMPLSGIVRSLAYARPVQVFGAPVIPQLLTEKNEAVNEIAGAIHSATAWLLLILVAVHIAGAAKRHFVDRDGTLARKAPLGLHRGSR